MENTPLSKEDAERFRRRVEYEDELLNTRTNVILTMNGLAGVAAGLSPASSLPGVVVVLMIVINACWLPRAWEASRFIGALTVRMKESKETAPIDEVFRWGIVRKPHRVGSTKFMAVVLPALLLGGWIYGALAWIYRALQTIF